MKILGNRDLYHIQTNDASVKLIERYTGKKRFTSCGPCCAASALKIAGWPMGAFTKGCQPEDIILNIFHNPHNAKHFLHVRKLKLNKYPPNEVPQYYPEMTRLIYGQEACSFHWAPTYEKIRAYILDGRPVQVCGTFPLGGHYILIVGFDDKGKTLIYNDPYPPFYKNGDGYNRKMSTTFFKLKVKPFMIVYKKYEGLN